MAFTYDHNGGTGGVGLLTIDGDFSGGGAADTTAANVITSLALAANKDIAALFAITNVGESDGSGALAAAGAVAA